MVHFRNSEEQTCHKGSQSLLVRLRTRARHQWLAGYGQRPSCSLLHQNLQLPSPFASRNHQSTVGAADHKNQLEGLESTKWEECQVTTDAR